MGIKSISIFYKTIVLVALGVVILPGSSFAAVPSTLGDAMTNIANSFGNFQNIHTTFAYIAGVFMAVWAIFKFKDHVDMPNQVPLSDGVKRLLAGGMFLAWPMLWEALGTTVIGTGGNFLKANKGIILTPAATPKTLDEVAVALIDDIAGPLQAMVGVFAWLGGLTFLMVGISRVTKTMQEGPRGPTGMGTIMTFFVAGALFNAGNMVGFATATLFGDASQSTYWTPGTDLKTALGAGEAQVTDTINALMIFVSLVGYIAFIRGFFVLRSFADGNQQTSLAQALTFLFGGALAINLGDLVNAIQDSLGYTALGFTFQ